MKSPATVKVEWMFVMSEDCCHDGLCSTCWAHVTDRRKNIPYLSLLLFYSYTRQLLKRLKSIF